MPRLASPVLLLLLAACSAPIGVESRRERDPRTEACRTEATRLVQWRDRGQLMRTDETESSRGTTTIAPQSRVESDRFGQQMERDRLVRECLAASPPGARAGAR
jgi:hypothetical protein